jgi:hypothetical protein
VSARDETVDIVRRICPTHLSASQYAQIVEEKLDLYRAEIEGDSFGLTQHYKRKVQRMHDALDALFNEDPVRNGPLVSRLRKALEQ